MVALLVADLLDSLLLIEGAINRFRIIVGNVNFFGGFRDRVTIRVDEADQMRSLLICYLGVVSCHLIKSRILSDI